MRPQMKATEEAAKPAEIVDGALVPFEDLRGVKNFMEWAKGPIHKEIRRVGGLDGGDSDNVADLAAGMDENEDYVTGMSTHVFHYTFTDPILQQSRKNIARLQKSQGIKALLLVKTMIYSP